jgi:hypothetical protein
MRRAEADEVSTRPVAETETEPLRSEVCLRGRATGQLVAGATLEAALETGGRYLLFLTDGIPHEDMLAIHLVDGAGRLLDSARLGQPYSTGIFEDLRSEGSDAAWFRFLGDADWHVEVFAQPHLAVPLLPDAPGVSRPLALRRWFRVHAEPRGTSGV